MNFNQEQIHNENGITFHFIPTKKFKTITITAKLKAPLTRETITHRALLPFILKQGTINYPTRKELQLKLDDLYGAILSIDGSKKGENHIISIRLEIANQQFIPKAQSVMDEALTLFNELLYKPNAENAAFNEAIFQREQETLRKKMHSIKDEKMKYANMRLIDEMCEGEAYQLHVHGYEEDLKDITAADLYTYYKTMLKEDQLDIYILGDFNQKELQEKITANLKRSIQRQNAKVSEPYKKEIEEPREVVEKQKIQQAKLHIGYRTYITFKDEDYAALQVFNGLFGGFPNSKLFINVREKNSLAYYAASRIESHKGLLFVFSGIAPANYEKARDIIRLQMEAMKNGEFTENELNETKELIINQLLETMDSSRGSTELLYQQAVAGKQLPPEMLLDQIRKVTKEDVTKAAAKIEEDTVYLLTSEGGMDHE